MAKTNPISGWINVKDAYPPKAGRYLVSRLVPSDPVTIGFFYDTDYTFGCFGEVTHWQPLPEPPIL